MKLEPIEPKWISPEAKELFDKVRALHDDVWQQCRIELGEDVPPISTATELAARNRYERSPERRAEIIEAYRRAAQPYADKLPAGGREPADKSRRNHR